MFGERWNRILNAKGDQIALWLPHGSRTFRELDAAARALSPLNCPRLGPFYLAQGDGLAITTAILAGFLTGLPVHLVEVDRTRRVPAIDPPPGTAFVKQTVGSSGRRRCQFFALSQIIADADRLHGALALHERIVSVAAISVSHSYGLSTTILQMLLHGVPVHWLPTPFPSVVAEALANQWEVFLPAVPAVWKAWLAAGLDLSNVTLAVSAGAPLSLALEREVWEKMGLKVHNLYGTSESGAIAYDGCEDPRTDAAYLGPLLPGVTATSGADGRLHVQSDSVGLGYDDPLPGEIFSHGRHLTWDRVQVQPSGLHFKDCLGAGINVAGRKLSPEEIADRIRAATGVRHIRIHGLASRDTERVQDLVACVDIPSHDLTPAFKTRACATLAPWEVPRHWRTERAPAPGPEDTRRIPLRQDPPPLSGLDDSSPVPAV